ncbi:unnamed protein product [Prorocentrum cordatum]|uniref:Alkyl hydroperoxide reductase subunit C/ Thiol specific antioxidant domain-containing protein n=1 Tax=Prorocentrum cordatum TaxID=2364126 RepID=A0ABN9XDL2_9DINO|nr:unnamed protein product [Polarella glacialis]|mmetsp:Transcript_92729/g.248626  ORF Transcript_92729/g.248626 Transcript_92729/m.248626 type:complete len:103 (+) Transcript_92729:210-518(+)
MVHVVGISTNSVAANAAFAEAQGFTYPLLCDTRGEVAHSFGAARLAGPPVRALSYLGVALPAKRVAVLVGAAGSVEGAWPDVDARRFPEELLAELEGGTKGD